MKFALIATGIGLAASAADADISIVQTFSNEGTGMPLLPDRTTSPCPSGWMGKGGSGSLRTDPSYAIMAGDHLVINAEACKRMSCDQCDEANIDVASCGLIVHSGEAPHNYKDIAKSHYGSGATLPSAYNDCATWVSNEYAGIATPVSEVSGDSVEVAADALAWHGCGTSYVVTGEVETGGDNAWVSRLISIQGYQGAMTQFGEWFLLLSEQARTELCTGDCFGKSISVVKDDTPPVRNIADAKLTGTTAPGEVCKDMSWTGAVTDAYAQNPGTVEPANRSPFSTDNPEEDLCGRIYQISSNRNGVLHHAKVMVRSYEKDLKGPWQMKITEKTCQALCGDTNCDTMCQILRVQPAESLMEVTEDDKPHADCGKRFTIGKEKVTDSNVQFVEIRATADHPQYETLFPYHSEAAKAPKVPGLTACAGFDSWGEKGYGGDGKTEANPTYVIASYTKGFAMSVQFCQDNMPSGWDAADCRRMKEPFRITSVLHDPTTCGIKFTIQDVEKKQTYYGVVAATFSNTEVKIKNVNRCTDNGPSPPLSPDETVSCNADDSLWTCDVKEAKITKSEGVYYINENICDHLCEGSCDQGANGVNCPLTFLKTKESDDESGCGEVIFPIEGNKKESIDMTVHGILGEPNPDTPKVTAEPILWGECHEQSLPSELTCGYGDLKPGTSCSLSSPCYGIYEGPAVKNMECGSIWTMQNRAEGEGGQDVLHVQIVGMQTTTSKSNIRINDSLFNRICPIACQIDGQRTCSWSGSPCDTGSIEEETGCRCACEDGKFDSTCTGCSPTECGQCLEAQPQTRMALDGELSALPTQVLTYVKTIVLPDSEKANAHVASCAAIMALGVSSF